MNKFKFTIALIASIAIFALSIPIALNNNISFAQSATECVSFTDDFTEHSGNWLLGDGFVERAQVNGTEDYGLRLSMTEPAGQGMYQATVFYGNFDTETIKAIPGDWTVSFDVGYPMSDSASPNFFFGAEVLNLIDPNTTGDYYSSYVSTDAPYTGGSIYADYTWESGRNTIASKIIPLNSTSSLLYFKLVKEADTLETFYSLDGINFTSLSSPLDGLTDEVVFRFFAGISGAESTNNSLLFGDFSLECAEITTPDPIPTPEPTDGFVEYPVNTVYRFYNLRTGNTHFYTIETETAQFVYENSQAGGLWPNVFTQETPTFEASYYTDGCIGDSVPVKRYRNILEGDTHFYAIKQEEIDAVENQFSDTFEFEEIAFCADENEAPGTVPVYRWLNTKTGTTHFYSADLEEKNYVDNNLKDTFSSEGIAFYAYPM